jgi:TonB family protein
VLAQFVIDTTGRPDMLTFKVLKSTHDLFTASVRASLPNMRFSPAQVGGKAVKQLIQMPFEFSMGQASSGPLQPVVVTARGLAASGVAPTGPTVARTPPVNIVGVPPRGAQATQAPPGAYLEYQVTKPVSPRPGNTAPRYPDMLRSAKVEGEVLAQFIVDENGVADTASFRVLKSTHDLFSITVRDALAGFRFYPAELNGRPVKQVVQMPFQFTLAK